MMEYIQFTYFSINSISTLIVLTSIVIYFILTASKKTSSWLIIGYFSGLAITFMYLSWVYSTLQRDYPVFEYIHYSAMSISSICLLQIPYYFPEPSHNREGRLVLIVTIVSHLFVVAYIAKFIQGYPFQNFAHHTVTFSIVKLYYINSIFIFDYAFAAILFIRRTVELSSHKGKDNFSPSYPVIHPDHSKKSLSRKILSGFITFARPDNDHAIAFRNSIVILLCILVIWIVVSLANYGTLNYLFFSLLMNTSVLVLITFFVITYINRSGEKIRFMSKIIGISFIFIIVITSNIGYITLDQKEKSYDHLRITEITYIRRNILSNDFSTIGNDVVGIFSSALENNPYQPEEYKVLFKKEGGFDLRRYLDEEIKLRDEMTRYSSEEHLKDYLDRWNRYIGGLKGGAFKERTEFNYSGKYADVKNRYILYDFIHGDRLYRIAYSYYDYRKQIHEIVFLFIIIVIIASVLIIAGFPIMFHVNLVKPLNNLLMGVRNINDGDLDSSVPVQYEDEIGYLTRSFNSMAQSIKYQTNNLEQKVKERTKDVERLNELKNRFLAFIAHDLKSPLKTLDFSIDAIVRTGSKKLQNNEHLETIKRTVEYMFLLLDDLSNIAMIESGKLKLQYEKNNYYNFILSIVKSKKQAAMKKNIKLIMKVPRNITSLYFDKNKITQVFDNLIENAIKYSDNNTRITVTAEASEKFVITKVIDQGFGIPEKDHDSIFDEYRTANGNKKSAEKSTGLGLSIAKKIISAHRGEIGVHSNVGEGSTFYFTLPVYDE